MDAMGIKTVLLLTDSQHVIDQELPSCIQNYPELCGGIQFRYIEKTRFNITEGGWENHYPSGNTTLEMLQMQLEFSLVQKCSMYMISDSEYSFHLVEMMASGFPLQDRFTLPHRYVRVPGIMVSQSIEQYETNCTQGNFVLCPGLSGRSFHSKLNDYIKNHLSDLTILAKSITLINGERVENINYSKHSDMEIAGIMKQFVKSSLKIACRRYEDGPALKWFCKKRKKVK